MTAQEVSYDRGKSSTLPLYPSSMLVASNNNTLSDSEDDDYAPPANERGARELDQISLHAYLQFQSRIPTNLGMRQEQQPLQSSLKVNPRKGNGLERAYHSDNLSLTSTVQQARRALGRISGFHIKPETSRNAAKFH